MSQKIDPLKLSILQSIHTSIGQNDNAGDVFSHLKTLTKKELSDTVKEATEWAHAQDDHGEIVVPKTTWSKGDLLAFLYRWLQAPYVDRTGPSTSAASRSKLPSQKGAHLIGKPCKQNQDCWTGNCNEETGKCEQHPELAELLSVKTKKSGSRAKKGKKETPGVNKRKSTKKIPTSKPLKEQEQDIWAGQQASSGPANPKNQTWDQVPDLKQAYNAGKRDRCVLYKDITLKEHQLRVVNFMRSTDKKGLIVYHNVGSGKTITAATIARCLLTNRPDEFKKVVILTPKSVTRQWYQVFKQLGIQYLVDSGVVVIDSHQKWLKNFHDQKLQGFSGEHFVLIIDEAHAFRTEQKGEGKDASGKYAGYMLHAARQAAKVVFLTATPVVNDAMDLVNFLRAIENVTFDAKDLGMTKTNLPPSIRNMLTNTISVYNTKPDDTPDMIERYEEFYMDPKYFEVYQEVESNEIEKAGMFSKGGDLRRFLNGIRRAANTVGLDNMVSPKMTWIKQNVPAWIQNNEKCVIYSSWLDAGNNIVKKFLDTKKINYVEVTGNSSDKDRQEAVQAYNQGSVKVMMISAAGSEGLDLKATRHVVIMEPYWNETRIRQTIGRAVRTGSHKGLPADQRNVIVHRLMLHKPKESHGKFLEETRAEFAEFTRDLQSPNRKANVKNIPLEIDNLSADDLTHFLSMKKDLVVQYIINPVIQEVSIEKQELLGRWPGIYAAPQHVTYYGDNERMPFGLFYNDDPRAKQWLKADKNPKNNKPVSKPEANKPVRTTGQDRKPELKKKFQQLFANQTKQKSRTDEEVEELIRSRKESQYQAEQRREQAKSLRLEHQRQMQEKKMQEQIIKETKNKEQKKNNSKNLQNSNNGLKISAECPPMHIYDRFTKQCYHVKNEERGRTLLESSIALGILPPHLVTALAAGPSNAANTSKPGRSRQTNAVPLQRPGPAMPLGFRPMTRVLDRAPRATGTNNRGRKLLPVPPNTVSTKQTVPVPANRPQTVTQNRRQNIQNNKQQLQPKSRVTVLDVLPSHMKKSGGAGAPRKTQFLP